jgi:hypothetical protein
MSEKKEISIKNPNQACETAIKALTSAVPILGGPISTIIGDIQSMRKEKRFLELINGLQEDLHGFPDRVNAEFVSKEDFLDIFEQTARKIVMTRQGAKRTAFRHILSNAILSSDVSYDEVEEFLSLVERFREEHIFLLSILRDPVKYDEETGNRVGKGGGITTSISQIMRQLLPNWTENLILEVVTVLENNERLVQHITSRYNTMLTDQGINHLVNTLTPKGMRFVVFISSPGPV